MSRELRDKAEILMKELNEALLPLREEITVLRKSDNSRTNADDSLSI